MALEFILRNPRAQNTYFNWSLCEDVMEWKINYF
jgi:hypothetical protein